MKKLLIIFVFIVMVGPVFASTDIDTLGDFMQEVRWELRYRSNDALPDSALIGLSKRAIVWTSIDIGGVEATYLVVTDTLQRFYIMPDSITEILFATVLNENATYSIKSFVPAYFEDIYQMKVLEGEGDDQTPKAYNYWADTVQLLPTPNGVDSIYFKCYIEHPLVDSKDDSIQLRPGFIEAAIAYTCHLVYKRWRQFDIAALYLGDYDALRAKLIEKYKKPFEYLPPGEQ